jgi:hypothetical protein
MKVLSFVALFLSFVCFANAQTPENSDQTLVKSFDAESSTNVVIDFKTSEINPQPWDGQSFRVEMIIKANMPIQVLQQLVKAGRYSLEGTKDGESYIVSAPNLSKTVTVRDRTLEEEIIISIKTPGAFALSGNSLERNLGIAARGIDEEKLKAMKAINIIEVPEVSILSTFRSDAKLELKTGDIKIDGVELVIEKN